MLSLTFENGRHLERVFSGNVKTQDDVDILISELKKEIEDNPKCPVFVELWKEAPRLIRKAIRA